MAAEQRLFTVEDTMRLVSEKAKEEDAFWVKVLRRMHMGAIPTLVATFSGATVSHFSSPELWIPGLSGGGKYLLQIYHASDQNKVIGSAIPFNMEKGEPRDVDASVVGRTDWRGPPILEFPPKEALRQQQEMPLYQVDGPPPAPYSGDSATKVPHAWARSAGGGLNREQYSNVTEFSDRARALEAERRLLEEKKLELEREKHKDQLDGLKKSHEADMRSLKSELMGAIQQTKPSGPDPMVAMLMEISKQQAEDRREAAKQAAEDRRVAQQIQAAAEARFLTMFEKMNDRPKEKDPLEMMKAFSELMGTKKDNGIIDAQTKMMHSMSEMMGQQVNVAMDFVSAAADMQLGGQGEKEPAWIKGIDKLVKGVGAMARAQAAQPVAIPQPPQMAATAQYQQPQPNSPGSAAQPAKPQSKPAETDQSVIDQLELAIKARLDPKQVAEALVTHFKDETIQKALAEAGGDMEAALYARLGNWHNLAPSNAEYMKTLIAEIEKYLTKAGFIDDGDSDGEDEDDGQGGDEADEDDDE